MSSLNEHTHPHEPEHTHLHGHHGHAYADLQSSEQERITHANHEHFDKEIARAYEDVPGAVELVSQICVAMKKTTSFVDAEVLDFACGTGLVSRGIAADAKSVVGADLSQNMLDVYDEKATAAGLRDKISSVRVDILAPATEGHKLLDGKIFDIITVSMAYHHFASPGQVTQALTPFLKPGGSLLIADFQPPAPLPSDGSASDLKAVPGPPGGVPEGVVASHAGYSESDVKSLFEAGGLSLEEHVKNAGDFKWQDKLMKVFVAKGVKKA